MARRHASPSEVVRGRSNDQTTNFELSLVTSPRIEDARKFENIDAALACYRGTTGRIRIDGKPDAPLTAYTVEFETWVEAMAWG